MSTATRFVTLLLLLFVAQSLYAHIVPDLLFSFDERDPIFFPFPLNQNDVLSVSSHDHDWSVSYSILHRECSLLPQQAHLNMDEYSFETVDCLLHLVNDRDACSRANVSEQLELMRLVHSIGCNSLESIITERSLSLLNYETASDFMIHILDHATIFQSMNKAFLGAVLYYFDRSLMDPLSSPKLTGFNENFLLNRFRHACHLDEDENNGMNGFFVPSFQTNPEKHCLDMFRHHFRHYNSVSATKTLNELNNMIHVAPPAPYCVRLVMEDDVMSFVADKKLWAVRMELSDGNPLKLVLTRKSRRSLSYRVALSRLSANGLEFNVVHPVEKTNVTPVMKKEFAEFELVNVENWPLDAIPVLHLCLGKFS